MSDLTFSKKIKRLPPAARKQARDFVDFLYQQYAVDENANNTSKVSIAESPIFGMWKNREDMNDSTKWVRDTRLAHWKNE